MQTVEISCEILHITENAVLVYDGVNECWIPKRYITDAYRLKAQSNKAVEIEVEEWIAKEKDLI